MKLKTKLTEQLGIEYPIICGAMYPCSNPELVAAVSEAGGIGVVQPLTLVYVYGFDFRDGLKRIRQLTQKPIGMNALIEKNSQYYEKRMRNWVDIALEEGCRFFVTALGNPKWVVDKVKPHGARVYHDVTELKWALKVRDVGVDGLICVNNRAGGHAGRRSQEELCEELKEVDLPLVCAGGVGDEKAFCRALEMGYEGVQMGTRFIATTECGSHFDYKNAIIRAGEEDIVLTERVTGIPLSVIRTPHVERVGLKIGPIARFLFRHSKTKHWIRTLYNVRSGYAMKRSALKGLSSKDYYQAGKSVAGIHSIRTAKDIVVQFSSTLARR
ncbi:MAG: nitronate monooxygenase [Deltaproteobacteria bacterium]|nr:nitronate monooxygenase [Deltaproteobacteria bacterium]